MATKKSVRKDAKITKSQAVKLMHDSKSSRDWDLDFKINHHFNLTENHQSFLEDAQSNNDIQMCIVDGPPGS